MAGKDNLKPIQKGQLSHEEAKARGSKGGKKSVEVRKERKEIRKALTDYYRDLLNDPDIDLNEAMKKIINQKNSASVSMLKEIREATEGSKIKLASDEAAPLNVTITPVKVKE
jgi:hypothetical protein